MAKCYACGGDRDEPEILVDRLPMHVNLGGISDWNSHIGWAQVARDPETGRNKIVIDLDEDSSKQLDTMVEAFQIRAIGFAGIKLQPEREAPGGG